MRISDWSSDVCSSDLAIARMLRRLGELAAAQISRRLAQDESGWSIDGATVQVLLARAWLRGTISPDAPLEAQFQELLSGEPEAKSLTDDRVESGSELVKMTIGRASCRERGGQYD